MIETRPQKTRERALLIGLEKEGVSKWDLHDSLDELRELANSAGAEVVDTVTQKLQKPTAPYYIGRGKAESIKESCQDQQVTSVIFNDELSPAQGRNLENLIARKVLDRTQLILDIFAQRARSREGRLQIELAQLQYLLPRLTRMWHHLSRQTGGIGTRGPGETQLEVDRRRVQERIARLERELESVRKTRAIQRQGRKRRQWPVAAVVGYTNAGKSTLLNLLTGADVVAEDKLFATLDPTTRSFVLPNKQRVLLTDTVGFLRKLPHTLIESFRATLEEVSEADLLIHIADLSHPRVDEQMEAVEGVIKELDAYGKQTLIVFNKIDNLPNRETVDSYLKRFPGSVAISARTGEAVNKLVQALEGALSSWRLRSRPRTAIRRQRCSDRCARAS
ncbi:MAG: GTPase HflX [Verrucomicrobia bacterium]|nr:MAG: GTPase HflX [Verrucomicrobiota bacterium]